MTFTCETNNSVFNDVTLDSATEGALYVTVTAAGDNLYDGNTEATITASYLGVKVVDETIKVCDYLQSGSTCGAAQVVLDLSSFIPDGSEAVVAAAVPTASITIESTNSGGTTEKCTQSLSNTSYQMAKSATKTAGSFLIGAVALIGLAAVVKRRKRSKSKNGADQRLYGGELA